MDLLVALTCGCFILLKIMLFVCAWVLTELLPHPVYAWKQMSPFSIVNGKKLSLQYCLKLSCNYNNPAYATVFNSKFHSVFESKPTQLPPLAIRVSGDLQAVGFKKSNVITSSIPSTPPWLLTRPAVNFTLHCSDKSSIPPKIFKHRFYELCHEFKITIAYLLMALKKVTELLLLWSIETVCSITWYSKHLQSWITCPTACDRCGPVLKRKEFCNLFWFHVKSAIYQRLKSWLRSCSKVSEGLHYPCKNGSQVMWESSVMKKQMQLQNRHSPYLSLV